MLILMLIEPFLYNGILYYFIEYLWIKPLESGGCCAVQSTQISLWIFFIIYLIASCIFALIITSNFYACATKNEITGKRSKCVLISLIFATLTNTHLFLFGFFPILHQAFTIQETYRAIRNTVVRNMPLCLLQLTLIGLLTMNKQY